MGNELHLIDNQVKNSDVDTAKKQANVDIDYMQKVMLQNQIQADIDFNVSKKAIMEATRKDNIRIKAAEQYAEFLKYISAADVVPAKTHFDNLVSLIDTINNGISDEDASYNMVKVPEGEKDVQSKS